MTHAIKDFWLVQWFHEAGRVWRDRLLPRPV